MKKVVLDTNLLFSALLSRNASFRETLFNRSYRFFSAKYLIVEIFKHKERIVKASKASEEEVYAYLHEVLLRIEFINEDLVSTQHYIQAHWLCKDTDENDVAFVALSLELDADLWSDDERLKTGLKKKGFWRFFEPE
jgi:predicted nucleic acid-binding protein